MARKEIFHINLQSRIPHQKIDQAVRGELLIQYVHGDRLELKLSPENQQIFQAAKSRHWMIVDKGALNYKTLHRAWFYWCWADAKPFVFVRMKSKSAHVELDMITTIVDIPERTILQIRNILVKHSIRRSHSMDGPKTNLWLGPVYCASSVIDVNQAENVAEQLSSIAQNLMCQQKR